MTWTEARRDLALVALAIVAALGLVEAGLRLLRPQPTYAALRAQLEDFFAASPYNTFELRKGYSGVGRSMEHPGATFPVHVNSFGFRGNELDAGKPVVLVVGDSFTFGVHVRDEEAYPAVLDRLLQASHPGHQVVNAGFAAGFETDQHYVWLKHNLGRLKPRVVVLGVFPGNDILGINREAWADRDARGLPGRWLDPHIRVAADGTLESTAGAAQGPLDTAYRVPLLRNSHVFILAAAAADRVWRRLTRATSPAERRLQHLFGVYSQEFVEKEAVFVDLVQGIRSLCEQSGARFLVALLPINFMVERDKLELVIPAETLRDRPTAYFARLKGLLAARSIPVVDIEEEMRNAGPGPYFPANGEVHFSPRGHALAAQGIHDRLARDYLK